MNTKDANELKRGAGYLKEKAILGLSKVTGNELDRAIFKVTSHKLKAPKEKYMQRVLAATHGHCNNKSHKGRDVCPYIVAELEKRLHTHNWIVILKTMVTFHRLLRDGSAEVNNVIQENRNIFCTRNIKDISESTEGAIQGVFIRQYLYYLEERTSAQRKLGVSRRIESNDFSLFLRSLDADTLGAVFDILLEQLAALVEIGYTETIVDNFCSMEAFQMLVNDGKLLYQIISDRSIFILDRFTGFTLTQKKEWVEHFRRYITTGEKLRTLFSSIRNSKRIFHDPPPELKPIPMSLLDSLERDVRLSSLQPEHTTESLESLGITRDNSNPQEINASAPPDGSSLYSSVEQEYPWDKQSDKSKVAIDDLFGRPSGTDNNYQAFADSKPLQAPMGQEFSFAPASNASLPGFANEGALSNANFSGGWVPTPNASGMQQPPGTQFAPNNAM
ncbi:unnamed protein product [Trypanosoma congolense IL3000]|uniref:WGS project CAEQ00000000 data, annotated contig 559 n=1 Tax=Trypanosoma congolense (strain IL3000) TaxID=1068625 RepID=F9WGW0_TRYCI|nr:unnamed protein product [Trypanosoma congolense IL3000]